MWRLYIVISCVNLNITKKNSNILVEKKQVEKTQK